MATSFDGSFGPGHIQSFDPKCVVIAGGLRGLNPEQVKTFELFRNQLRGVEVVTFSELLTKTENLVRLLETHVD